ncbi:serine protease [Plakobranchus ocellatus]|uniref:Serine protease n=1 Tax=Plakobranchus ocellatus TaxID=259542 RepID=A0AAV3Z1E8_9GAST|nr:serine protease [Plakobranchus ocellatus]
MCRTGLLFLAVLCFKAVTVSSSTCGISLVNSEFRIVGGEKAQRHEFPWQVSLMHNGQHTCGGTLIDDQWVLTAAHCFKKRRHSHQWRVVVGLHDKQMINPKNSLPVAHIYRHRGFNTKGRKRHRGFNTKGRKRNDIALVKLKSPVNINRHDARAACLPSRDENFVKQTCVVTGWGYKDERGNPQRYLQKVSIPVQSNRKCNTWFKEKVVTSHMMCAGYPRGSKDSCEGDSGGPLVCKANGVWKLAGIVSFGVDGCARPERPGVYTRVSSYLDWIDKKRQKSWMAQLLH